MYVCVFSLLLSMVYGPVILRTLLVDLILQFLCLFLSNELCALMKK